MDVPNPQLPVVVHKSVAWILWRTVLPILAFFIIYALLVSGLSMIGLEDLASWLGVGGLLVMILVLILVVIGIIFWWRNNYYVIHLDHVIQVEGLFWYKERLIRFPTLDELQVTQSFLGTLLKYGDLTVISTETNERVHLRNIPRPNYYEQIIRLTFPEAERL